MVVIKRDGRAVPFSRGAIVSAIEKAMNTGNGVNHELSEQIATEIESEMGLDTAPHIEDIELMVFNKLVISKQSATAKAYEGYRSIREFQRNNKNTTDSQINELLSGTSEYWNNENSNKNAVLVTTQRDYMAGIVSSDISRRFLLPPDIVQAHDSGIIHFHDMDYFAQSATHNCCLINLEDMLQNGTVINGVKIEKPHRLITATTIATQIIIAVSSSQFGGTTISLTHLAPFVRSSYNNYVNKYVGRGFDTVNAEIFAKEDLEKEIADSVQTFNYQINSMTTTNGQSPFVSVNMYIGENKEYSEEVAMLIREFLIQRIKGMKNRTGDYVTQAFPKLLYILEPCNMPSGKYYDITKLSAECTAKRMVPDYISSKVMSNLKGSTYPCMGCRSFLTPDCTVDNMSNCNEYEAGKKYYGRFNQGVVTINLPDVALSSKGNIKTFWEIFDARLSLCHKALQCRHERLSKVTSDVAPILWQDGALARLAQGESIHKLLHGGYSTISLGYAGLYECVKFMTGDSHTDKGIGEKLGLEIMQRLNDYCKEWKGSEDIDYSVYGSPIESTTYKFAKTLKARFGEIEGITDKNYITNSYHVPVFEEINPFDKLSFESKFQELSPGGAISYIECANMSHNVDAVIAVMTFIYENIMYAELNTKSDFCQVCKYDGEIEIIDINGKLDWKCPNCGNTNKSKMNVTRRVCGYLGTNYFNQGRTQEIKDRFVHLDDHILGGL